MTRRWLRWCMTLMLLGVFVPASLAWADGEYLLDKLSDAKGNIRSGYLRFHPGIEFRGTYDDNIFNTAGNEEDDFITSITPGMFLSMGSRHKLELGYAAAIHSYSDHSGEDFVAQHGRVLLDSDFPSGFRAYLKNRYLKTEDPRSEELQLRASHKSNDLDASLGYEFPGKKLTIELLYALSYLKYDQAANREFNKTTNVFGVATYYKFLPKTSALVEYKHGVIDHFDSADETTDKDAKFHAVNVGLMWDATAKLSGTIKTGWKTKKYDNNRDAFGNPYADNDMWSVEGLLAYNLTERTRCDIVVIRSLEDTEYTGSAVYSRATNFLNTGAIFGVEHKLMPKLALNMNVGVQRHEYNGIDITRLQREDRIVDFGIGLNYAIQDWLMTEIKYSYYKNNSDDDTRDERHNKMFVSVTVAL